MEGWLKKKSPKTQGKKVMDVWQKRYFVLAGGELRYYKTEKLAGLSNSEPLKSIPLSQVLCATVNPRHADMFVIDLGLERKVKLQASSEAERDAWVGAIEDAKLKAWSAMEDRAFQSTMDEVRRTRDEAAGSPNRPKVGAAGVQSPAQKAGSFGSPTGSSGRDQDELLGGAHSGPKKGCCIMM